MQASHPDGTPYNEEPEFDAHIAECLGHVPVDFPQVERHEDPWGDEAMSGYVPWLDEDDDWIDLDINDEDDLEDTWDLGDDADEEPFGDNHDWEENRFDFLYRYANDEGIPMTATGRLREQARERFRREIRDPRFVIKLEGRLPDPIEFEVTYIEVETDYASLEQSILEALAEDAGLYTRDAQGHLRDEKGRCLACLRPGVHR